LSLHYVEELQGSVLKSIAMLVLLLVMVQLEVLILKSLSLALWISTKYSRCWLRRLKRGMILYLMRRSPTDFGILY